MDSFHFIQLDFMEHNGFEMYYKKPINKPLHSGIPDSEENMVFIQNISYKGYEVYYKNK